MERAATYTQPQAEGVDKLLAAIKSVPPDKDAMIRIMAETFISGMKAQERLSTASRATAAKG